jgi:hypothetical protein
VITLIGKLNFVSFELILRLLNVSTTSSSAWLRAGSISFFYSLHTI